MSDQSPESHETLEIPAVSEIAEAKRSRLIGLLGISAACGVFAESHLGEFFFFAGTIGSLLLIVSWCQLDARERGYRIPRLLMVMIVLIGVIGVPVFLIRTRGMRGIWSCLLAVLFLGVMVALNLIGSMATPLIGR